MTTATKCKHCGWIIVRNPARSMGPATFEISFDRVPRRRPPRAGESTG